MTVALDHDLPDPENFVIHTRRPRRIYRWPAIFLTSLIGLLLLSEVVGQSKGPITQHADPAATEDSWQQHHSPSDMAANGVSATFLTVDDSAASHGSANIVLHSQRTSSSSPNSEWRVQLTSKGDIVLERNKAGAFVPIWWANRATYPKRLAQPEDVYATLDADGVLTTHAKSIETGKVEQLWTSSDSRLCSVPLKVTDLTWIFPGRPRTQSLMVDDLGRLVLWPASGAPTCILSDHQHTLEIADRSSAISMEVQQDEARPNNDNEWPLYSDSSKYTNAQIRAMLQQDVTKLGMTFELDETQLQTIYSDAIIIPSWHGHVEPCYNFLRSMIRHCVDCDRWQINLILNSEDVALFQQRMFEGGTESLSYWLPGLRIIVFEDMKYEHYAQDVDVANATTHMSKFSIQNFKKQQGCFASGKRYCSVFDSEGIIIRTTWYSDFVKEYLDAPFVIHHPESRNGSVGVDPCSDPAREVMNIENFEAAGWMLSYYNWIFDSTVYSEVARMFAERWPLVVDGPQAFFNEIGYYAYIWGKVGPVPGPEYRFITPREILGDRLYQMTWDRHWEETGPTWSAIIEDVRFWMKWYPYMLVPAAQAWNDLNLHIYKASATSLEQTMSFLSIAKSVHICVSEQPRDLFEAAMTGIFNEI